MNISPAWLDLDAQAEAFLSLPLNASPADALTALNAVSRARKKMPIAALGVSVRGTSAVVRPVPADSVNPSAITQGHPWRPISQEDITRAWSMWCAKEAEHTGLVNAWLDHLAGRSRKPAGRPPEWVARLKPGPDLGWADYEALKAPRDATRGMATMWRPPLLDGGQPAKERWLSSHAVASQSWTAVPLVVEYIGITTVTPVPTPDVWLYDYAQRPFHQLAKDPIAAVTAALIGL